MFLIGSNVLETLWGWRRVGCKWIREENLVVVVVWMRVTEMGCGTQAWTAFSSGLPMSKEDKDWHPPGVSIR